MATAAERRAAAAAAKAAEQQVEHATLALAFHAAQQEMPGIQKDAINPHLKNKYASLASIIPTVLETAGRHGLAILQMPAQVDGGPGVRTTLIHATTGESYSDLCGAPTGGKDTGHAYGSGFTYLRRYAITAVFGLVTEEDDDGNGASSPAAASVTPAAATAVPAGVVALPAAEEDSNEL